MKLKRENVSLEWKLPGSRQSESDNMASMLDHKVLELSTYMKNKKILRVRSSTTFARKRRSNA